MWFWLPFLRQWNYIIQLLHYEHRKPSTVLASPAVIRTASKHLHNDLARAIEALEQKKKSQFNQRKNNPVLRPGESHEGVGRKKNGFSLVGFNRWIQDCDFVFPLTLIGYIFIYFFMILSNIFLLRFVNGVDNEFCVQGSSSPSCGVNMNFQPVVETFVTV